MVDIQELSQGFVSVICMHLFALLMIRRSYWTWVILSVLIVVIQLLGVGEKLWIKVGHFRYE